MSRLFSPPCSAERKSLKAATPFVVEYVAKPVWPKNTSDCFMPTSLIWLGQERKCFAAKEASLKSFLVLRWLTVHWHETFLQFLGVPLPSQVPYTASLHHCLCLCFTSAHHFYVPPTWLCVSLLCTYHLPQSFGALPQLLSFRQMARQKTWLEDSVYCVQKHLCIRHGSQIIELSIFPLRCCWNARTIGTNWHKHSPVIP